MHRYSLLLSVVAALLFVSCKSSYLAVERASYQTSDTIFMEYIREQNIPVTKDNRVEILNGASVKFKRLFDDIRLAKHHIHLEYFNFRNDSINKELLGLLTEKVKEGVEVRILFDAFGNSSNDKPLKKEYLKEIRATGIEIEPFDPIKFPWVNHFYHRDHRKIAIIDGNIGYCGGINVADYYLTGLEDVGEWRDMHARVQGEAAAELQKIFLEMWNKESGKDVGGIDYFPQPESAEEGSVVAVVDRWPRRNPAQLRHVYANAINAAKDSIKIVNPYFVPTKRVSRALKEALKDSVKVEIMVSSKSDISFTPDAVMYIAYKFLKRGAKIYLYDGGFNHAKAMSVDGNLLTIGSANLDARSLCYDYENNLFVFGEESVVEFLQYYNEDKRKSRLMTRDDWKKISPWRKFVGWLGNLITPFL